MKNDELNVGNKWKKKKTEAAAVGTLKAVSSPFRCAFLFHSIIFNFVRYADAESNYLFS
jgi:hypothetical protein